MAVTKTLIEAVPCVPNGDLRKVVDSWELTMSFQVGEAEDSDFLYKEYSGFCSNDDIIKKLGASKPAIDFTRAELESLCLIEEWTTDFHTLSTSKNIQRDTSFTIPS
tara:strand:+ start:140 stop:460 length:321 start_codon:yes stop_codon:yes gene_type:complete